MRVVILLIWIFSAPLLATPLSVKVQQSTIKQGQPFVLTLQLQHGNALEGGIEPNFSHLSPTFSLIKTKRASFANFVNDGIEQGTRWQLTLTPNYSGKLEIPAIRVGANQSHAFGIEVVDNATMLENIQPTTQASEIIKQQTLPTTKVTVLPVIWWWLLALVTLLVCWWLDQKCHYIALWRACRHDDFTTVQQLLLAHWHSDSLGSLAQQLDDPVLADAIMTLDRYIYGKSSSWHGNQLWQAFKAWKYHRTPAPKPSLLPELYRQSSLRK